MQVSDTITHFSVMLGNLDQWLEAATAYAGQKGFEADVLAQARLAPDQYALVQQVQSACDQAKYAAAYLSGQKPPSHPDTEKTIAELRARVKTARDYLASFKASAFEGAEKRDVAPAWMQGHSVRAIATSSASACRTSTSTSPPPTRSCATTASRSASRTSSA